MNQPGSSPVPHPTLPLILISLMFIGFISLGLPDGLLGVAWPSFSAERGVPLSALGYILTAGTSGFIIASLFSGRLIARLGVGRLLAAASLTTALSLIGIGLVTSWWLLLLLALLLGAGGGCIDGGLNNYAAATTSPRVLAWLHGCYGIGATAGPLLMTTILAAGRPWSLGYLIIGTVQLLLALTFLQSSGLWAAHAPTERHTVRSRVGLRATLGRPVVWPNALLFTLYTGLEASAGQWTYTLFTIGRGIEPATAGLWIALYWGGLTFGRFATGVVATRFTPRALLWSGSLGALVSAILIALPGMPWASAIGMPLLGIALAPIFPALIGTTAKRVGSDHASNTIGIQLAAASIGAAAIPWVIGQASTSFGVAAIGMLLVGVVLLYVLLFVGVENL